MTTEATQTAAEAPKPGTPEHDAAMAAKFENRNVVPDASVEESAPAAQPAQRPEWFPENLWKADKSLEENSQALATSYSEARKAISQKTPTASTTAAAPAAAAAPEVDLVKQTLEENLAAVKAKPGVKPEEITAAEQVLAAYKPAAPAVAKVDFTPFEQEYAETGDLSAESRTKLEGMGFPKATVNQYLAGIKATEAAYQSQAHEAAGGKDAFAQMTTWAATALTEAEVNAFNDAVTSGNVDVMRLAVQGLNAKFVAANGQQPKLLGNGGRPGANTLAFRDRSEMTAAMRDPRYATSEAYRQDVAARIAVSNF